MVWIMRKPQGSYPERFQNLSLIDSIGYVLFATELDKDVVQSYLATLATPNQLIQLTMCCSQAQLETAARQAAARRVWAAANKGNKAKLDATTATSSASASASAAGEATETKATDAKKSWADYAREKRRSGYRARLLGLLDIPRRSAETLRQLGEWLKTGPSKAKRRGWKSLQLGAAGRDHPVGRLKVVAR